MSELWDAYDEKLNLIEGKTLIRGESIDEGCYHVVCGITVRHIDGTYLLMKRDFEKTLGGKWELSAGGSVLKGEKPVDGAVRELREETGIIANNIKEIGRYSHHNHHSHHIEYLCVTDCDKDSIVLQEGETIDYKWVDRETLIKNIEELATTRVFPFVPELKSMHLES